jgi:hypothetical protein
LATRGGRGVFFFTVLLLALLRLEWGEGKVPSRSANFAKMDCFGFICENKGGIGAYALKKHQYRENNPQTRKPEKKKKKGGEVGESVLCSFLLLLLRLFFGDFSSHRPRPLVPA